MCLQTPINTEHTDEDELRTAGAFLSPPKGQQRYDTLIIFISYLLT